MKQTPAAVPEPLAITFRQFFEREYPYSRARANEYVRTGELDSFLDRGRRMVLYSKVREFVARKASAGGAISPEVAKQKSAAGRKGRARQLEAST